MMHNMNNASVPFKYHFKYPPLAYSWQHTQEYDTGTDTLEVNGAIND